MIEQKATVISADGNTVWLEAERQSTCSQCSVRKGCGTGLLARHVGQRFSRIAVAKEREVQVGEQVSLEIPEQALLQGAMMMYILPLLTLFLFAGISRFLNLGDLAEIFAGLSGLLLGFLWVHSRLKQNNTTIQAKIAEREK